MQFYIYTTVNGAIRAFLKDYYAIIYIDNSIKNQVLKQLHDLNCTFINSSYSDFTEVVRLNETTTKNKY